MRAFEFQGTVNQDATLLVPPEIAAQIQQQPVRVIVLLPDSDEEKVWAQVTAEQFFKGYAESDAIYDQVSAR
jgi:hypothetical protein